MRNLDIILYAKEMKELFLKIRGQESSQVSFRINLRIIIGCADDRNNNNNKEVGELVRK